MSIQDIGRHCKVFDKVVVDFTSMTDEEVLNYFSKQKGNICGRISEDQLYNSSKFKLPKKLKVFVYSLVLVFLIGTHTDSMAQSVQYDSTQTDGFIEIYGRVIDEKRNGVVFATVTILEGGVIKGGGRTDMNGYYKIKLIRGGNNKYDLKVAYIGYQEKMITQTYGQKRREKVTFFLEPRVGARMGAFVITTVPRGLMDKESPNKKIITKEQILHSPW